MKTQLYKFFFKDPAKWWYWFLFALVFKLLFFIFQISVHPPQAEIPGFFGTTWGDTFSYLDPIDKLVTKGSYWPDYRMPGYGLAYLPFRLIFSKAVACNLLVILQLLVASISVYLLAQTAKKIFHTNVAFYSTFYIYTISCLSNLCDASLQTESLTVSLLIIATWFFVRYFDSYNKRNLLWSGFFLTWTIFFRPVFSPLLAIYFLVLIFREVRAGHGFIKAFVFLIPFILMDGLWIARNYRCYKSIIPLTRLMYYPAISENQIGPTMEFVRAWGGDYVWWNAAAEVRWFGRKADPPGRIPLTDNEVHMPSYIYTSKFNEDSLKSLKKIFIRLETDSTLTDSLRAQNFLYLRGKFYSYIASIRQEKPMVYYVKGPLRALKRFLINSGNNDLFYYIQDDKLTAFQRIFKLFYCCFYYIILVFSFIGILLMGKNISRLNVVSLIPIIPLFTIIIHPIILRVSEYRYLMPAFPFLIVCALYGFYRVYNKTLGTKHPVIFSADEN